MRTRELIHIRGIYRYRDHAALVRAIAAFRAYLEGEAGEPLRLRCRATGDTTLTLDIVVPMFTDHSFAPAWCQVLGRTAVETDYDVWLRPTRRAARGAS